MMTDLHSHILPGIDDGAADPETAVRLLELEHGQGVRSIALTSHYNCENTSMDAFLAKRASAWLRLREQVDLRRMDFCFKLGSEVCFSPQLLRMDVHRLCLEGSDVLLLELPVNHRPQFFREALEELQSEGIIPLIAHVERYPYVLEDPTLLADWLELGAYAQINAGTLLRGDRQKKMALRLVKWGLVQVIASDTHSPDKRPPRIQQAMREIETKLGSHTVHRLIRNADALFSGQEPEASEYYRPRQFLGQWL